MVDIKSRRGYILALAIIFMVVMAIVSIGMYAQAVYSTKEVRVDEVGQTRGYYAGVAALRYASILLRDPVALFGDEPDPGDSVTRSLWNDYNTVARDIGLDSRHDVLLTVTKRADGEFDVSASYTY